VLLCLRFADRGVLLRTCLGFDNHGVHYRGEFIRVDVDGLHGSWFEAAVLDFEPARGPVLILLREPGEIASAATVFIYGCASSSGSRTRA
jgi:hypothetical protein